MRLHALSLALFTAACAGGGLGTSGVVVYNANYPFYSRSDYAYAASAGGFPVDIRGNPTPAPQGRFEQAVVDAMQGKTWGPSANFVVQPRGETPQSRIVLGFGTTTNVDARALCETASGPASRFEGEPVVVAAAFCSGDRALSRLIASVPGLVGPEDPRLDALMGQVVGQLLPPENPDRRDDRDRCLGGFVLGC